MNHYVDSELVIKLAEILKDSHVDSDVVKQALEQICDTFKFSCAFVYDVDYTEQFCLMEQYLSVSAEHRKPLIKDKLTPVEQSNLTQKDFWYVQRSLATHELEKNILQVFDTEAIVLAPVMDENKQLYGVIVLLADHEIEPNKMSILKVSLTLLVRYVSVRMYQKKLIQAQKSLENILDNTGIDIYVNDFITHDILYVNKSMAAPYGGTQEFQGRKCWQVLFPGQNAPCEFCPQKKLLDENNEPNKVYSWDYQRPFDGSWFRVFSAAFRWTDGRLAHVVSSADITDNKQNEALIENLANYDQLTKLPNRRVLIRDCELRINKATEQEKGYVIFLDIDDFKTVNDSMGHDAGDELLIQLGEFFSSIPMLESSIYRNGGDEFVAIIGGESISKGNIHNLANFIHRRFNKAWKLKKGMINCGISIGVACYPEDGSDAETLIQKADSAMYHVKKNGKGGFCFTHDIQS